MVEREHVQVEATDDVAAARAATEHGAHAEAVQILSSRQRAVARAGDSTCLALLHELREIRARGGPAAVRAVRARVRARRAELARAAARHVATDCVRRRQGGDAGHAHRAGSTGRAAGATTRGPWKRGSQHLVCPR